MSKIILLLLCALMVLLEPETTLAAAGPEAALTEAATAETDATAIPRPNYKRYRGNSRSKKRRLGFFRRRAARRKAARKAKQRATAPKGRIQVDAPVGTMPPRK